MIEVFTKGPVPRDELNRVKQVSKCWDGNTNGVVVGLSGRVLVQVLNRTRSRSSHLKTFSRRVLWQGNVTRSSTKSWQFVLESSLSRMVVGFGDGLSLQCQGHVSGNQLILFFETLLLLNERFSQLMKLLILFNELLIIIVEL